MIQPLNGVRVVDFTHGLAGPLSAYHLGLLGAEVIKVERPVTGDNFRERGNTFEAVNAGKRSLVLDTGAPDAPERIAELLAWADIVVHNFRPSVAKRTGLAPEDVLATKPEIVICTVSGFGLRGDWADRPAIEWTAQAASGLMTAYVDIEDHSQGGVLMLDPFTGMLAVQAMLAAWIEKLRTGKGSHVDVSLLDAAMIAQSGGVPNAAAGRKRPAGGGERPGVGRFVVSDGTIYIAAVTELWQRRAFEVLGLDPALLDELKTGDDFAPRVRALIEEAGRERSAGELATALTAVGVPAAAIETLTQLLEAEHPLRAHVSLETAIDREGRELRVIGSSVRYNGTSLGPRSATPQLGEFNEASDDVASDFFTGRKQ